MEIWIKLMSITIFSTMYLGVVTDPEAVKDNDFDEVVDPRESLDKLEEGNIKLQTGNSYWVFSCCHCNAINVYTVFSSLKVEGK